MKQGMNQNNLLTTPLRAKKSVRLDEKAIITSGNAGKIIPIAMIPLLREDAVQSSRMRIAFEMMETAETLFNGINVRVNAHLVPKLAFERFHGMDELNMSYQGVPREPGGDVIPYIETDVFGTHGSNEIYKTLGIHGRADQQVNQDYIEAYNAVVNHRRKLRSSKLELREMDDTTLAPAFWSHTTMKHIVPDFDQAIMDGEVALNVVNKIPVSGIGISASDSPQDATSWTTKTAIGQEDDWQSGFYNNAQSGDSIMIKADAEGYPEIFAEMAENGVTVSLSNIEMAKKTQAFAKWRAQYQGHDDDYVIDLLMSGIRIPDQAMKQPILLQQKSTVMGYSKRYATDADNLDESVTVGQTFVDLALRTPPINTGGVIVITAEITPEQLFERQKDHYLHTLDQTKYPEYTRDELDPEKVSIVPNDHVDIDHNDPEAIFGFAPLNYQWMRAAPNIGGKYYRPTVDASFDEDRQKIWANETADPELTEDFYLCTNVHHKVFADTISDAFEISARGLFQIVGNTVFGPALREATDDYDVIIGKVDQTRLEKPTEEA